MCSRWWASEWDDQLLLDLDVKEYRGRSRRKSLAENGLPKKAQGNAEGLVRPTDCVDILLAEGGQRVIKPMRWNFIPRWMKEKPAKPMYNARSETIAEKPFFRSAWADGNRGILLKAGFTEFDDKQNRLHFRRSDGHPMIVAALWEAWQDHLGELEDAGSNVLTCATITTEPNGQVAEVHDRMPVIIDPNDLDTWLTGTVAQATQLLKPWQGRFQIEKQMKNGQNELF